MSQPAYNPAWITAELHQLGFTVEASETNLVAFKLIPYEGTLRLTLDFSDQSLNLQFLERFSKQTLLFHQAFLDDEHLMDLLTGNYVFYELVISRDTGTDLFVTTMLDILSESAKLTDINPLIKAIRATASTVMAATNVTPAP